MAQGFAERSSDRARIELPRSLVVELKSYHKVQSREDSAGSPVKQREWAMEFLSSQHILEEVQRLVSKDGDILAAVAFWGCGAVEQTGIAHKNNGCVRILCDLFSGSCNPNEIQILLSLPSVKVRTLYGMHAKVWVNDDDHVIVGSANASMNGLGFEAGGCNVEAAVQLRSSAKAKQIREWFEENWVDALEIDQQNLDEVKDVWDNRQNKSPHRIMNYHIGAYLWEESDDAPASKIWRERHPNVDENQGFYFFEHEQTVPQPGTLILDFTCEEEGGEFTFNNTWKIDGHPDPVAHDGGQQLVDLRREKNPKFPIARQGVKQMIKCSAADNCWNFDDDGWYVYMRFADFFYGTRARCHNREDRCEGCPFQQEHEM